MFGLDDIENVSPIDLGIDWSVEGVPYMDSDEVTSSRKRGSLFAQFFDDTGFDGGFNLGKGFDVGFDVSGFGVPYGKESNLGVNVWDWGISEPKPKPKHKLGHISKPHRKFGMRRPEPPRQVQRMPEPSGGYHMEFTKENVAQIENRPGIYRFYDKNKKLIYIGRSHILKHRLQSYYQKDDFDEHKTKAALRDDIAYFNVEYKSIEEARDHEHRLKDKLKHNHL